MSKKKNRKKIKKMLRAQAFEQIQQQPTSVTSAETSSALPKQPQSEQLKPEENRENQDSSIVKKEIKKILITMGVIVLVIVAVYFINQKTDWILQSGKYLTKLLNINL